MAIAFNSFIEAKRGNPIDFCQFAIQDDPDAADSAAQRAALTIEVRIAEAFPEDQPSWNRTTVRRGSHRRGRKKGRSMKEELSIGMQR